MNFYVKIHFYDTKKIFNKAETILMKDVAKVKETFFLLLKALLLS